MSKKFVITEKEKSRISTMHNQRIITERKGIEEQENTQVTTPPSTQAMTPPAQQPTAQQSAQQPSTRYKGLVCPQGATRCDQTIIRGQARMNDECPAQTLNDSLKPFYPSKYITGSEPNLSQSQKSALDAIARQGFVRMKPEPDNFKVQNKEFIKLDLNNPEGEVESGYSNVFTDLVVSEFKGKFPKGLFVYKKTGKEAPAASSQKIEITRENCRKAVFELHDYMKNRQSTLMTPEQRRTNVQTVRRCMDNRNKLGALNFEYNRKLKDLQDNNEI